MLSAVLVPPVSLVRSCSAVFLHLPSCVLPAWLVHVCSHQLVLYFWCPAIKLCSCVKSCLTNLHLGPTLPASHSSFMTVFAHSGSSHCWGFHKYYTVLILQYKVPSGECFCDFGLYKHIWNELNCVAYSLTTQCRSIKTQINHILGQWSNLTQLQLFLVVSVINVFNCDVFKAQMGFLKGLW